MNSPQGRVFLSRALVSTLAYWICTLLFCGAMLAGGISNLLQLEEPVAAMEKLGYPQYLLPFLGVWKLLGILVLLAPNSRILKEWAYAGFTFDLLGAGYSYIVIGDAEAFAPLTLFAFMLASYLLRPKSRSIWYPKQAS